MLSDLIVALAVTGMVMALFSLLSDNNYVVGIGGGAVGILVFTWLDDWYN